MINPFKTCKLLLDPPPGGEGHDTMMNDMKHGEMGELLPQHEEDGVQVIDVLAEEIPPGHIQGCIPILENENGTVVGDYKYNEDDFLLFTYYVFLLFETYVKIKIKTESRLY